MKSFGPNLEAIDLAIRRKGTLTLCEVERPVRQVAFGKPRISGWVKNLPNDPEAIELTEELDLMIDDNCLSLLDEYSRRLTELFDVIDVKTGAPLPVYYLQLHPDGFIDVILDF